MLDILFNAGEIGIGLAIMQVLQILLIVIIALTVHEVAHGLVAKLLGDDTAAKYGRLSLNPVKHLDPWGFLCMLIAGFGWAKPVPIRARNFKNARVGMALSALAGPVANLLLAVFAWAILETVIHFVPDQIYYYYHFDSVVTPKDISFAVNMLTVSIDFLITFVTLNVSLAIFNFIPVPPLDGSRVLYSFLPDKLYFGVMKYEHILSMVIMVLLITDVLDKPLMMAVDAVLGAIDFIIPII